MGITLKWDITYSCNLFCAHCLNGNLLESTPADLSCGDILVVVGQIRKVMDIDYIHFLGGEPTHKNDFLQICNGLQEMNVDFGFNTNAINFANKKLDSLLNNKNLKQIVVSLEGPTAAINDKIRGKNVFDVAVKNLRNIILQKPTTVKVAVNTVVSKVNLGSIIEMIDFCVDLGVDEFNMLELIQQGSAEFSNDYLTNDEELDLVEKIALKYSTVKGRLTINPKFVRPLAKDYCAKVLNLDFPEIAHYCGAGLNFAFLNNKADMYPCDRFLSRKLRGEADDMHSISLHSFLDVWGNPDFNDPFSVMESSEYDTFEPCNRCSHFKKDCFPCYLLKNTQKGEGFHFSPCDHFIKEIESIGGVI